MVPKVKPGNKHPGGGMSSLFHDYAGPALPDHMLHLDLPPPDGSTNHMMYELEPFDQHANMLSPCASTTESTSSYFDDSLCIRESSDDLLDLEIDDVFNNLPPFVPQDLKLEDVFQLGKRPMEGPTLAALNGDQSESPLDEAEEVLSTAMDWNGLGNQVGWGSSSGPTTSLCQNGVGAQSTVTMAVGLTGQNSCNSVPHATITPCKREPVALNVPASTTVTPSATSSMPVYSVTGTVSFVAAADKMAGTVPVSPLRSPQELRQTSNTSTSWTCSTLPTPSATVTSATAVTPIVAGTAGVTAAAAAAAASATAPASPTAGKPNRVALTDTKWEEIKQFIHDDMELNFALPLQQQQKQQQPQQLPATIVVKPEVGYEPSGDCDDMDPADSEDEDMDSDADSEFNVTFPDTGAGAASFLEDFILTGRKEKRYFWQYNTQSKGPKGKRLCKSFRNRDPHVLDKFEDPVFDPELNQNQYKHNGKARRGDGNDVNANPWKLYQIGRELAHLNRQMSGMVPVSEMPSPARSKTRKEKNKYASRACRLKKKAQHEAHKLKLHGLHQEHAQLLKVLRNIREKSVQRITVPDGSDGEKLTTKLDSLIKDNLTVMIAGHTTEFVNSVLENIAKTGDRTGGVRPISSVGLRG